MNFLAHHWLAGADENLQLGAWLGDFVKGRKQLDQFSAPIRAGIQLHRSVDSFVDSHELTLSLKSRFPAKFRRYSGIILDLMADHFLARDWNQHDHRPLAEVEQSAFVLLDQHDEILPARLKRFISFAKPRSLLSGYRERSVIVMSLAGISQRFSHSNPLTDTAEFIDDNYAEWEPVLLELLSKSRAAFTHPI